MTDARRLTRAEQKARRPTQILEAAFEEFVANGFVATRVEDIADRIDVTKGTIYVYFPTKEDLFLAVIDYITRPLQNLLQSSRQLTGTCSERIQSMIVLFYDHVSDDRYTRELIRFVIAEGTRFPNLIQKHHDELIGPIFALVQSLLDEGMASGEFRKVSPTLAPVIAAPVIALMVETLIFGGNQKEDVPAYIRAHLDLVMNGIAVTRS